MSAQQRHVRYDYQEHDTGRNKESHSPRANLRDGGEQQRQRASEHGHEE